jgi:hypothetical protein
MGVESSEWPALISTEYFSSGRGGDGPSGPPSAGNDGGKVPRINSVEARLIKEEKIF